MGSKANRAYGKDTVPDPGEVFMKMQVRNKAARTDEMTALEQANRQVAYQAALEGIVLLENDGCLPIRPGKIALYGAGADMTIKGGTGSGEVNERHAVSILEGLEAAGFTVTTKAWIQAYEALYRAGEDEYARTFRQKVLRMNPAEIMDIVSSPYQPPFGQAVTEKEIKGSQTDTCIYVVARQAGEGADKRLERWEYTLSQQERDNIALCAAHYEKMIVVINVGAAFDMSFYDEIPGIQAVIFFAQQGTMGGVALADLITGKENFSGRLADTWARRYEDIPGAMEYSYLNGNVAEEYYREGIYVGYRYFDSFGVEPRYPFGYGLSYTNFAIETKSLWMEETRAFLQVEVSNTGHTYAGRQVVQVYASCPQKGMHKEYQRLAAFAKTDRLMPGESQMLLLSLEMESLASYREADGCMVLEAGDYVVRVGENSRHTQICGVLRLEEEVVTERMHHVCARTEPVDEIVAPRMETSEGLQDVEDIPVLLPDPSDFVCRTHCYGSETKPFAPAVEKLLDTLTLEEQVALTVGTGLGSGKYFHAPGSAGATTGKLLHKGIPNVSLADGPAGLRLQQRTAVLKNGKCKAVDPYLSLMKYIPDGLKKVVLADPEKHPILYQFATAFPVGLALAQTWNTALLEQVGDAVGREMEAYGVTYWLAPGMNIHRNPLCGRNFEYYSEDPFLSGVLAASMTRGVQSHRGCYVTLKHYCCNNQEDNRNKTNANISERALREIYLRGFEIAVRQARPGAVMTSYNKVNGTYVNNSRELVTDVLRGEWGFDGLVMTDWFATGRGLGSHALCIAAGNDLIMPGTAAAEKEILQAVKKGSVTSQQVRECAANVLRGILSSRIYQGYRREQQKNAFKK